MKPLPIRNLHPGVAVGALVDIRLADDKQDVLRPPEGDTSDALNVLEAELGDSLASLLLVARVDGNAGAGRDVGFAALVLGVR